MSVAFDPGWLRPPSGTGGASLMEEEGIWFYIVHRPATVLRALRDAVPHFRSVPSASLLLGDALGAHHVVTLFAPRAGLAHVGGETCLEASSSRDGRRHLLRFTRGSADLAVIRAIEPIRWVDASSSPTSLMSSLRR